MHVLGLNLLYNFSIGKLLQICKFLNINYENVDDNSNIILNKETRQPKHSVSKHY